MAVGSTVEERMKWFLADKRRFIEAFLKIKAKPAIDDPTGTPKIVPFIFNPMQADYWPKRSNRDINVKARQLGFSSEIEAEFFSDSLTIPGLVTVIVSHTEYAAHRLLEMVKLFYETLPEALQLPKKYDSAHEISFPDINSVIYIGSASTTKPFGHGDTVHRFHGSEVSRWHPTEPEKTEEFLAGIEEAVPMSCRIVLESTANGEGDAFHTRYKGAKEGTNIYKPHFYAWWWDKDYSIPEGSLLALPKDRGPLTLTAEEQALMLAHNLSVDQIRFRRRKQADRTERFLEQYAEDDITCFLTSGQSVFDLEAISRLLLQAETTPPIEILDNGCVSIWRKPIAGAEYILAADPAEGNPHSDFSDAVLIDRDCKHCLSIHGRWEPRVLASKLVTYARMYNEAIIAPERNNHGHTVIDNLIHTLDYHRLFYNRDLQGNIVDKPGWLTGATNKTKLISEMDSALTSGIFQSSDKELLRQLRGFRYDGSKNLISSADHDDLAMAAMIAVACNTILPHFSVRIPSQSYGI